MADQTATPLDLPSAIISAFGQPAGDTGDMSAVTFSKGSQETTLTAQESLSSDAIPGGRGGCSSTGEAVGGAKERCKTR